jgi:hypothetical protein
MMLALVADLRRTFLSSKSVSIHHAPKFGLICGLVGFDSETAKLAHVCDDEGCVLFFFERKRGVF